MFRYILYIILAIIVLLLLITVHELGHYIAGKLLGFKINEFSIGFGKSIYSKTRADGEKFSIRIFPLGGYCAFEGEDQENPSEKAFNNQKPWKRLIVLFSGVFFNFLFGIITAVIFLASAGSFIPRVYTLAPNNINPLEVGDKIISVNGEKVGRHNPFSDVVKKYQKDDTIKLTVNRDGEIIDVTVQKYSHDNFYYVANEELFNKIDTSDQKFYYGDSHVLITKEWLGEQILLPEFKLSDNNVYTKSGDTYTKVESLSEFYEVTGIGEVGSGESLGFVFISEYIAYTFWEALLYAVPFCLYICGLILSALGGIFTGATGLAELGGTVTAISQIAEISQLGINQFLLLLPLLSMNLALFNILPIPALDGARMVFIGIEWIFKKPVNRKVEAYIHGIGLMILFGLVIFLDIYHFFIA